MTEKRQQPDNPNSILIVDDDEVVVKTLKIQLEDQHWEVLTAQTFEGALEVYRGSPTAVALVAIGESSMEGVELARGLRQQTPELIVILMTGYPTLSMAVKELKNPAYEYLVKPFRIEQLLMGIERANRELALIRENRVLRHNVEELQAVIQQSNLSPKPGAEEKEVSESEESPPKVTPYAQYPGKIPGGDSSAIASYERHRGPIPSESSGEEPAIPRDSTDQEGGSKSPSD